MDIYEKMKELGVELPAAPAKGGLYSVSYTHLTLPTKAEV